MSKVIIIDTLTDEQVIEIANLVKKFEDENNKPKKVIDYNDGWVVFYTNSARKTSTYSNDIVDCAYLLGLYRDTKEECEALIRKMQIEHRLREWAKLCKDKVDWNDETQKKYFICNRYNIINIDYVVNLCGNHIYFTDELILQKAVEDIGKQKLIDEYFVEV